MTNNKLIVLILAINLIISIGIVIGQDKEVLAANPSINEMVALTVAPDNTIIGAGNNVIAMFSPEGKLLNSWSFPCPKVAGLAVLGDDKVLIADGANQEIYELDLMSGSSRMIFDLKNSDIGGASAENDIRNGILSGISCGDPGKEQEIFLGIKTPAENWNILTLKKTGEERWTSGQPLDLDKKVSEISALAFENGNIVLLDKVTRQLRIIDSSMNLGDEIPIGADGFDQKGIIVKGNTAQTLYTDKEGKVGLYSKELLASESEFTTRPVIPPPKGTPSLEENIESKGLAAMN